MGSRFLFVASLLILNSVVLRAQNSCGSISYDVFYINGVRFKADCGSSNRLIDSVYRTPDRSVFIINELRLTDSLFQSMNLNKRQVRGIATIFCEQDSESKIKLVFSCNVKSKIFVNEKLMYSPYQIPRYNPFIDIKASDIISIRNKKPFLPWQTGKIYVLTK